MSVGNDQEQPRRAVAYIRESTEEQGEGYSPDAQRQAIARFAGDNRLELVGEYVDFHSGWRHSAKRPEFQRMMADAAEHAFDVILVYHSSRFARSQVDARRFKALLRERLNIAVISVTQPFGEDPRDPSVFLAESINEIFDEYHSVTLSFWTRTGLREKARQGHLVGSLPWGYTRDTETGLVIVDDERAPLVRQLFELYARGDRSDRSLAIWLNSQGARTTNDRPFTKDTVREMLVNAAYAGYVSARRDKARELRGLHPAIVSDDLFERVQQVRAQKTTTLHPGRPSEGYVLSKLLHCDRCGGRMHGTRGGRQGVRRYYCATRKQAASCDQPITLAEPLEEQLATYVRQFVPPAEVRKAIVRRLKQEAKSGGQGEAVAKRTELEGQLKRLKELYILGDLPKSQYLYRRQLLQQEIDSLEPPVIVDVTEAARALTNFGLFWERETDPGERNKLLRLVFDKVWANDRRLVAVRPRDAFLPYFQFGVVEESGGKRRERRDSNPRPPA